MCSRGWAGRKAEQGEGQIGRINMKARITMPNGKVYCPKCKALLYEPGITELEDMHLSPDKLTVFAYTDDEHQLAWHASEICVSGDCEC
jgi:hypothetical protein